MSLQLTQCANAMRTSPGSFASIINSVCNYADFQTDVTQPPRPPFSVDSVLRYAQIMRCPAPRREKIASLDKSAVAVRKAQRLWDWNHQ